MNRLHPKRLPRSNAPLPGEALGGYLLALAHRLGLTPGDLAVRVGLGESRMGWIPNAYAVRIPTDAAERFAAATGMTIAEVTALTAAGFEGVTFDPAVDHRHAATEQANWWLTNGRFCPDCLSDTPSWAPDHAIWKTAWLTPWAIACTDHKRLLVSDCPNCGIAVGGNLSRRTGNEVRGGVIPNPRRPVTHPAACRASIMSSRSASCGGRYDHATAPIAEPEILALQDQFDRILSTEHVELTTLGAPVEPLQWLRDMRTTMTLIHFANPGPGFFSVPYARDAHESVSAGGVIIKQPPTSVPAHAGLALAACHLLNDPAQSSDINRLFQQAMTTSFHDARRLQSNANASPALAYALRSSNEAITDPKRNSVFLGTSTPSFEARHVPAFLSEETYEKHFADIDPHYQRPIRRAVPIALIRMVTTLSSTDAGRYLGYDEGRTESAIARASDAFNAIGASHLRQRIADIAADFKPGIDFGDRRARISRAQVIADEIWADFQKALIEGRMARADTPWEKRRPAYSAWVWGLLTHGDFNAAPMITVELNGRTCTGGASSVLADLLRRTPKAHHDLVGEMARRVLASTEAT